MLQEKFTLREIFKICTEFAARSYDDQDDVPLARLKQAQKGRHRASARGDS